jgi:hypothetical protein
MSSISEGPRNFITTPDDHGGIALTVSTLLMTWMILCCLIRIYLRADVNGPFGLDDLTVCVATVGFEVNIPQPQAFSLTGDLAGNWSCSVHYTIRWDIQRLWEIAEIIGWLTNHDHTKGTFPCCNLSLNNKRPRRLTFSPFNYRPNTLAIFCTSLLIASRNALLLYCWNGWPEPGDMFGDAES